MINTSSSSSTDSLTTVYLISCYGLSLDDYENEALAIRMPYELLYYSDKLVIKGSLLGSLLNPNQASTEFVVAEIVCDDEPIMNPHKSGDIISLQLGQSFTTGIGSRWWKVQYGPENEAGILCTEAVYLRALRYVNVLNQMDTAIHEAEQAELDWLSEGMSNYA
jgi:hypothetical protein